MEALLFPGCCFSSCCRLAELLRYSRERVEFGRSSARKSSKVDTLSANIFSLVSKLAYSLDPTGPRHAANAAGPQSNGRAKFRVNVFDEGLKVFPLGEGRSKTTNRQVIWAQLMSFRQLFKIASCFSFGNEMLLWILYFGLVSFDKKMKSFDACLVGASE